MVVDYPLLSSFPLTGNFQIKCVRLDGTTALTAEMRYDSSPPYIKQRIIDACHDYINKIEVFDDFSKYSSHLDGREFKIRFFGVKQDVGQFSIVVPDTSSTPLAGDPSLTYGAIKTIPRSKNLFYDPIPFDFFTTQVMNPQVRVTVDNLPAVCAVDYNAQKSCDYAYITSSGLITAFTV
jgi:hypothetical protein